MEELMYYIWQQRLYTTLPVTPFQDLEIIDPGLQNHDSGPDFFNAKLKIDGTLWAGNIALHERSTDWYRHGHEQDPAYNNVILHVVLENDGPVSLPSGQELMQVTLPLPEPLVEKYRQLTTSGSTTSGLTCADRLQRVPRLILSDWKTALAFERMGEKTRHIEDLVHSSHESWSEAFYVILSRALGTGTNSDAFERTTRSFPYKYLLRHIDHPIQVTALLFGQAGFFEQEHPDENPTLQRLRREYAFLRNKFTLTPLPLSMWKFGGVRPAASPLNRMAILAALMYSRHNLFDEICEAEDLTQMMQVLTSPLHATPPLEINHSVPLGKATLHSLIINAVVPILLAYAQKRKNEALEERALSILESIPAEKNRYVEACRSAGLTAENACDSQALLQLYRNYCERHLCLRCRIGHWLMRH
jgi:hypothetical protein